MSTKIFGIGLNKTGTTTLGECGSILGYRCTSFDRDLLTDVVHKRDFARVEQTVARFDLFEDWPWPLIYEHLDQTFPGSKFILTVRADEDRWLSSLKKHSMMTHPIRHCRKLAYGHRYPHGHEEAHLSLYREHNDAARSYFSSRRTDFRELCWENGDGWKELCEFLGQEIPTLPFPHKNRSAQMETSAIRLASNRLMRVLSDSVLR